MGDEVYYGGNPCGEMFGGGRTGSWIPTGLVRVLDKTKFRTVGELTIEVGLSGFLVYEVVNRQGFERKQHAFTTLEEALKFIKTELSKPTQAEFEAEARVKEMVREGVAAVKAEKVLLKKLQKKYGKK